MNLVDVVVSQDDSIAKRINESEEELLEPVPLQFNYPDPNWQTPRNYHVTGYSPFSMGLATPIDTPEAPPDKNTSSEVQSTSRTCNNSGPKVMPHILDIALAFAGRRLKRKTAEVDGTEPPNHNVDGHFAKRHRPVHTDERNDAIAPPKSSGLPPRAPVRPRPSSLGLSPRAPMRPSSHVRNHEHADPLLHKSLVTPPCPILPEGEFDTPVEQRRYTHVSTKRLLKKMLTLVMLTYSSCCIYYA